MPLKTYNFVLLGSMGAVAALLCGATLYYEPVVGDLTRLGGYSENNFGWRNAQPVFQPALAKRGNLSERYDIVVVGDSVSSRTTPDRQTPEGGFWTDFLSEMMGQTVGVFDLDKTSLTEVLASPVYRSSPPKLVIYESVERALDVRFPGASATCPPSASSGRPAVPMRPLGIAPASVHRNTSPALDEERFHQTVDHLKKSLDRLLLNRDVAQVLRAPLSRADLFSNRRPSEILLIADDLRKKHWSAQQMDKIGCGLSLYQRQVEANGTTKFIALIAPDKSAVYASYLPARFASAHLCPVLAAHGAVHLLCVDSTLSAAVATGIKDVYLPNDTHWGSASAELVARAVSGYAAKNLPPSTQ